MRPDPASSSKIPKNTCIAAEGKLDTCPNVPTGEEKNKPFSAFWGNNNDLRSIGKLVHEKNRFAKKFAYGGIKIEGKKGAVVTQGGGFSQAEMRPCKEWT